MPQDHRIDEKEGTSELDGQTVRFHFVPGPVADKQLRLGKLAGGHKQGHWETDDGEPVEMMGDEIGEHWERQTSDGVDRLNDVHDVEPEE